MQRTSDRTFNLAVVLGGKARDPELTRACAALLSGFADRAGVLLLGQMLAAVIALKICWKSAASVELAGFSFALLVCLWLLIRMKTAIEQGLTRISFAQAQWRVTIICLASGVTWSSALLMLASPYDLAGRYLSYTLLTALISISAMSLSPLPLAAIVQIAALGIGGTLLGWEIGSIDLALIMAIFSTGMAISAYFSGRRMLRRCYGERRLAEQNEVVRLLLKEFESNGGDLLWEVNAQRQLENVSPRFADFFGRTPDDIEGQSLFALLRKTGISSSDAMTVGESLREHTSFRNLLVPITVGNDQRWCQLSASPRYNDEKQFTGFRGVLSDVTKEQLSAHKISHMARYDALTGLPNRAHIHESLQETVLACQRDRKVAAFMLIDLDRFKLVNDSLGHPVGDKLLEQVAARLKDVLGPHDLPGRLGGDEFAVLLRDVPDVAHVNELADRIIATLSHPYQVDEHTLFIGASIGSAICPKDGHIADKLVRNADLALYKAKEDGRGIHRRYEPALYARAEERRNIEIALRDALERGELSLEYQPIVASKDKRIIACEALLRWRHPTLGLVPPDVFIPVAEDARLISRIGEWVMRTACMEAVNWPPQVHVAVNLSVEQFLDPHLFETIISALSHSGLDPSRLELEITESVFIKERCDVLATLDKLINIGIRVALDDFGTSYSSLGFLGRTKFSTIKIDRRYVRDAGRQTRESQAVIRAVVAMAESLGMNITAEGAESDEELACIRELGCDQAQGYLFSRPLTAQAMRKLLRDPWSEILWSAA